MSEEKLNQDHGTPNEDNGDSLESYGYKQEFKRVLKLRNLVIYGMAYVTPTAPFPMLGIVAIAAAGHMATAYIVAMIGLMFTASSYGKMAARHPIAGSSYSYTRQAIHPHVGFIVGWALFLTYLLIPALSVIAARDLCAERLPMVPSWIWIVLFVAFMTAANMMGIKIAAWANTAMTIAMLAAGVLFIGFSIHYLLNQGGVDALFSMKPFYNPQTFDPNLILAATAISVFSFVGFDAISTLSEEAQEPRKNIGRATLLTCLFCGIIFVFIAYMSQMVWPDYSTLPNDVSAVLHITKRVGGNALYEFVFIIMIVAGVSSALAGQTSAARLMYGLGRDRILPNKIFGYVSPKSQIPVYNVIIIAFVSIIFSFNFDFGQAAQMVNYGAFLGFVAVNICVFSEYVIKRKPDAFGLLGVVRYILMPLFGFLICLTIFLKLSPTALTWGTGWVVFGLIYYGAITRGFRKSLDLKLEE